MRDRRFVAAHRGGPLDQESHRALARWAAECAERALPWFTRQCPNDDRPGQAIETAREWANGEIPTGVAMKAAVAAHAAARQVGDDAAALAAARAAGHAVATAHFADHCLGAWLYARKALVAAGTPPDDAADWNQPLEPLPADLREAIATGLEKRWRQMERKPLSAAKRQIPL